MHSVEWGKERYQWYFALAISTAEQIYLTCGSDQAWAATCKEIVEPHLAHLQSVLNGPGRNSLDVRFRRWLATEFSQLSLQEISARPNAAKRTHA